MKNCVTRGGNKKSHDLAAFEQVKQIVYREHVALGVVLCRLRLLPIAFLVFWVVIAGGVFFPSASKAGVFTLGDVVVDNGHELKMFNAQGAYPFSLNVEPLTNKGAANGGDSVVPFFALGNADVAAPSEINAQAKGNDVCGNYYQPINSVVIYIHFLLIALNVAWVLYVTDFMWRAKRFLSNVVYKLTKRD